MALEKADRTEISKFVRDTVQRLPPRAVKAMGIGRISGTPQADTPPVSDSSDRLATTAWVNLQGFATQAWVAAQGFLTSAPVSSVFGRTGAVVAQSGDYTAAQVTSALDLSNSGVQSLAGTLSAGGLKIGGNALPGTEIGYDQITANVAVGTTVTTIIAGSAHTFDGSPVLLEFFSPDVLLPSVAGGTVSIDLFDGATQLNILSVLTNAAAVAVRNPTYLAYRFTPSAGSHTYAIKANASATTGTPAVQAGTGALSSGLPPAFLRITKI